MLQVKPEDRASSREKKNQNGAHIQHDCNAIVTLELKSIRPQKYVVFLPLGECQYMNPSVIFVYSRAQELVYKTKQVLSKPVSRKMLSAAMG